jgi:HAD superfamily hydrolase (TIGR01509 family)
MSYALIFDMDGVLADTESLIARASIAMFRELYGVEMQPEDFRPFIGTGAVRYVEGPAEQHGVTIDIDAAVERRHENFVALIDSGESIAMPGAAELVADAAEHPDWKLAIATSSPTAKAIATLKAAKIDVPAFDVIVTGDMVTHKKPHPEIYLATSEQVGITPNNCVVVEDALTGVTSAKAAGMSCLAITNSFPAEELVEADRIVDSLEQVNVAALQGLVA